MASTVMSAPKFTHLTFVLKSSSTADVARLNLTHYVLFITDLFYTLSHQLSDNTCCIMFFNTSLFLVNDEKSLLTMTLKRLHSIK